ncbi:MAG: diacylglycerol kinase family protein [candidate division KSB1 bacterium]|nr:diacylglycerol kinase family protein [candidate division KSB1 bacterium]
MNQSRFSLRQRARSFRYAFRGLAILVREEHNARIHLVAAVGVIAAGVLFRLSRWEWVAVTFAIGLVFSFELLNSALERLADVVSPERSEAIGKIKDLSAAGVLMSALTALVIGLWVFVPKIVALW